MGQAAVDLPDPSKPTEAADDANASSATAVAAPAPLEGADDLLAQLAGEEIDRLLAEADEEPAAARKREAAESEPAAPASGLTTAAASGAAGTNLADVLDNAAKSAAESVDANVAEHSVEDLSVVEREIDSLLADASPPSPLAPAKDEQTSAVESAALLGSVAPEPAAPRSADDGREPFLVRLLEWINAPFAALSDNARDTIGKLAILTFFNALAVLLYVLMFRPH
jgi:hypothetical protein